MRKFSAFTSFLLLFLPAVGFGQPAVGYPAHDGDKTNCKILIEMPRAHVSGVCLLAHEGDTINGAVINEFGMTALGFRYLIGKDEVKLESVNAMIDKWYIKRVLHQDLRELLHALKQGRTTFVNERHHITYSLSPMDGDVGIGGETEETKSDDND